MPTITTSIPSLEHLIPLVVTTATNDYLPQVTFYTLESLLSDSHVARSIFTSFASSLTHSHSITPSSKILILPVESRGLTIGTHLSYGFHSLGLPTTLYSITKPRSGSPSGKPLGKTPLHTIPTHSYNTEYSHTNQLFLPNIDFSSFTHIFIADDVCATGGTFHSILSTLRPLTPSLIRCVSVLDLPSLLSSPLPIDSIFSSR